jgi:hypothetical protein
MYERAPRPTALLPDPATLRGPRASTQTSTQNLRATCPMSELVVRGQHGYRQTMLSAILRNRAARRT